MSEYRMALLITSVISENSTIRRNSITHRLIEITYDARDFSEFHNKMETDNILKSKPMKIVL
jgi:hypothetical protein